MDPKFVTESAKCTTADPSTIKLIVETLTGKSLPIFVSTDDRVQCIKSKIHQIEGIPIIQQNLLYRKEPLEDSKKISDIDLKYGSILQLVLSMRGGPISYRRLYQSNSGLYCYAAWKEIKEYFFASLLNICQKLPSGSKISVYFVSNKQSIRLVGVLHNQNGVNTNFSTLLQHSYDNKQLASKVISSKNSTSTSSSATTSNYTQKLMEKISNLKLKIDHLISTRTAATNAMGPEESSSTTKETSSLIFSHNNKFADKKNDMHTISPMTILEDVEPEDGNDSTELATEKEANVTKTASIECLPSATETTISTPTSLLMRSASMSQLPCISRPSQNRVKILARFVLENDLDEEQQQEFDKIAQQSPTKKITNHSPVPTTTSAKSNLQKMRFASVSAPKIDTTHWSATNLINLQCESASKLDTLKIIKTERLLGCRVSDSELDREKVMPKFGRRASFAPNTEPRKYRERTATGQRCDMCGYNNLGFVDNMEKIEAIENYKENVHQNTEEEIAYEMLNEQFDDQTNKRNELVVTEIGSLLNARPLVSTVPTLVTDSGPPLTSIMKRAAATSTTTAKSNVGGKSSTKNRCGFCSKRINITNMHMCRCGSKFCAAHRYAEVHGCNYDYKTEGREWLTKNNPVVVAPKIAKI